MPTKTTTDRLKKVIKNAVKPPKKLTRAEKISNARTHPLVLEARRDPEGSLLRLRDSLASPVSAEELATRIGCSRSNLYKELLPALGVTFPEVAVMAWQVGASDLRTIARSLSSLLPADTLDEEPIDFEPVPEAEAEPVPASAPAPIVYAEWWTRSAEGLDKAVLREISPADHEVRIAAIRYWTEWVSTCAIGQPNADRYTLWVNPLNEILGQVGSKPPELPSDEDLRKAPSHLLAFAAYVAGEVLESPRKTDPKLDEIRHLAAFRWTVKLVEIGCVPAAKTLSRCAHTAAAHETAHAVSVAIKSLVNREDQRRLDERLGKKSEAIPMSEDVYNALSVSL